MCSEGFLYPEPQMMRDAADAGIGVVELAAAMAVMDVQPKVDDGVLYWTAEYCLLQITINPDAYKNQDTEEEEDVYYTEDELKAMTIVQVRRLATEVGVKYKNTTKKTELIEALLANASEEESQ